MSKEVVAKKLSVAQIKEQSVNIQHIYDKKEKSNGPKFGCRHVQIALIGLGLIVGMGTRSNLSIAIVAMTDNSTSSNPNIPTYDWHNTSVILSSFYWSYISLQVIAGYLCKTYGPKYFLLASLFINFCACALTPTAAEYLGSEGVMICRIVQGLGQGFLYPSFNVILGQWAPEQERSTLFGIAFTGVPIGSMYATLLTGYISASSWGWPASFYFLSGMGFLWCILWLCFSQNSPASHPRITEEEKIYIQSSLKQEDGTDLPVPWRKIFTCVPFYALIITYACSTWCSSIVTTEIPTYLSKIMKFNVKSSALATSLPNMLGILSGLVTAPMSDWLIRKNILSTLNLRRISNLIGYCSHALLIVWLAFLKASQKNIPIIIFCLNNISSSFILVGSLVNHLDLSPRFSGVIYGILNAIGQTFSIIGPLSANWIVTDMTNASQWRTIFLTAAGVYVLGAIVFFFFASASRQTWDGPESPKMEKMKKKISVISVLSL